MAIAFKRLPPRSSRIAAGCPTRALALLKPRTGRGLPPDFEILRSEPSVDRQKLDSLPRCFAAISAETTPNRPPYQARSLAQISELTVYFASIYMA
jgi:hypothetical protein